MGNFKEHSMKIILFFSILLSAIISNAQGELDQNLLDSLYSTALQNRFDWILSSGYKYVDFENQSEAPLKNILSPIKILPKSEIAKISRKENKELIVYTLSYNILSEDTVDVNFGKYKIKGLRKKNKNGANEEVTTYKYSYETYVPDMRFVLVNNRWKIIKSKFNNE